MDNEIKIAGPSGMRVTITPPSTVPDSIKEWMENHKGDPGDYQWKLYEYPPVMESMMTEDGEVIKYVSPSMSMAEAKAQEEEYKRMEESIPWLNWIGR